MLMAGTKKPPCCGQAARGLTKKPDGIHPAISQGAAQGGLPDWETCHDCRYIKAVRTQAEIRKHCPVVCTMDGERIRQADPACGNFRQSGTGEPIPDATFPLTRGGYSFKVKSPNCDSHTWRLVPTPIGAKVHAATARNAHIGRVDIGGAQRPYVREATAAYHRPGSVVCPAFPFKPLNCEVSMNTQTPDPITLPAFRVNGADIIPADGVMALHDAFMALHALEQYIGGGDEATLDAALPVHDRYGLAYVLRLIGADVQARALNKLLLLNSETVQKLLDDEAQDKGADHGE